MFLRRDGCPLITSGTCELRWDIAAHAFRHYGTKLFGVPVGKGGKVKAKDAEGQPIEITRNATAARWTFVIGKDGYIAATWDVFLSSCCTRRQRSFCLIR